MEGGGVDGGRSRGLDENVVGFMSAAGIVKTGPDIAGTSANTQIELGTLCVKSVGWITK